MKSLRRMSVEELAGLICQALRGAGITVTLTGGACVAIWSDGKYVSHDLDFIEEGIVTRKQIIEALRPLGFTPRRRHFVHPDTEYLIEFPNGPLMVGDERVRKVNQRATATGILRLLSPTDCVKDRLAAYFHWNDRQSLEQALLVAKAQKINLAEIRRWSKAEQNQTKFKDFKARL